MTHSTIKDMEEAEKRVDERLKVGDFVDQRDVILVMHLLDYYRNSHDERVEQEAEKLLASGKVQVCDKPACTAAVIKSERVGTVCANGHDSRWVDVRQLRAWQERAELLRDTLEDVQEKLAACEGHPDSLEPVALACQQAQEALEAVPPPPSRGDAADRAEERLQTVREFFWLSLGGMFNRGEQIATLVNPDWLIEHLNYPHYGVRFEWDEAPKYQNSGNGFPRPRQRVKSLAGALATAIEEIEDCCDCHPDAFSKCGSCRLTKKLNAVLDECWVEDFDPREKRIDDFSDNDWDAFHDVVFEVVDKDEAVPARTRPPDLREAMVRTFLRHTFQSLPEYVKQIAYRHGLSDTPFRDAAYEHLQKEEES